MRFHIRGGRLAALVAATALLTVAACSSDDDGDSTESEAGSSADSTAPEKSSIVISDFVSGLFIPVQVALASGSFEKYGLDVTEEHLNSSAATAAVVAGQVDLYLGGAAAVAAHVNGSDIIYVGSMIDRTSQYLMVNDEIESVEDLKGTKIAIGQPGAFAEILVRKLADEQGWEIPGDLELLNNPDDAAQIALMVQGTAAAAVVSSPANSIAEEQGFTQLVDFSQDESSRLIAPGIAVSREFAEANPNTVKAFISGYLDGLRRTLDDPEYAKEVFATAANISDQAQIDSAYEDNEPLWNRDLTIAPEPIELVLEYTPSITDAASFDPEEFFDNSYVEDVNATLGKELFPDDIQ